MVLDGAAVGAEAGRRAQHQHSSPSRSRQRHVPRGSRAPAPAFLREVSFTVPPIGHDRCCVVEGGQLSFAHRLKSLAGPRRTKHAQFHQ